MEPADRLIGCLLGTAVGDSIGLPSEGLARERIARRWPAALSHHLLFGRGLISDDTEHAFLTVQCLSRHRADPEQFARALAWRLRWWFIALPGGVGLATARACIRLWCGVPPGRSGVWSAGNGPAMRAPIIGAFAANDHGLRLRMLTASTRLTHRDPKALVAASAIAETSAALMRCDGSDAIESWERCGADDAEWLRLVGMARECRDRRATVAEFASAIGCVSAVSGYSYHSVPVALYGWLRHRDDARAGIEAVVRCGGDTDSTAAIAGALFGIEHGEAGLPADWLTGIVDFPLTKQRLRAAGRALAEGGGAVSWWWPLQPLRNVLFLVVVLAHGFWRIGR